MLAHQIHEFVTIEYKFADLVLDQVKDTAAEISAVTFRSSSFDSNNNIKDRTRSQSIESARF